MPPEIRIDASDLGRLAEHLGKVGETLESQIVPVLNEIGEDLVDQISEAVAAQTDVDPDQVLDALRVRPATNFNKVFTIESDQSRFNYVRWMTQEDERVCPICGPMHGIVLRESEAMSRFPAHPNCRCRLDPVAIGDALAGVSEPFVTDALEEAVQNFIDDFSEEWNKG